MAMTIPLTESIHMMTNNICTKKKTGSITVEAAVVLPTFLIGMFALISIGKMMVLKSNIQYAIYEEAHMLANVCEDGHCEAVSNVKADICRILMNNRVNLNDIEGCEDGLSLTGSRLDNGEYVEIVVDYRYMPFGANYFGLMSIPISQKCVMHINCGYISGYFADTEGEYVYVTEGSSVYHINRECTHIKLTVTSIQGRDIPDIRNSSGAKYKSCKTCHSKLDDAVLYITPEGDRYHNTVSCSGLKRTVRAVKISDIGDRRPCSRCGR